MVRGQVLEVDITHDSATYLVKEGKGLEIRHCNKKLSLKKGTPVCEKLVCEEFPDTDVDIT